MFSRQLLLTGCFVACLFQLAGRGRADSPSRPLAAMGGMVGEVTSTSALVQVRLTAVNELTDRDVPGTAGRVEFTVLPVEGRTPVWSAVVEATAARDFIARAAVTGLAPGQRYVCRTQIGGSEGALVPGPIVRFRTLAGGGISRSVSFVVVTGMNYAKFHGDNRIDRQIHVAHNNTKLPAPYAGTDKHWGYPALQTILSLRPDFFVGTGDNVYYDTPREPRAKTIVEMRQKWHEQFIQPRYVNLFAEVPTYWEIDDHDYRVDDGDNTGDYLPTPEEGRAVMLEQLPVAAADDSDAKTYRTHRVSRELQVWFTENRMYRSPNKSPDGPNKTIWGVEQKAWLKRTLLESDATFKLLISPNPMIGPDDKRKTDNHTNIGGFQHERDEFFRWLVDNGLHERNFYVVCGDRHWQYHSIHPLGIEEFSCGALVDANSRLGRKPGDPKSTDPEGEIRQPYYQTPASAGFLRIEVHPNNAQEGSELVFNFHDERGELLYRQTKRGQGG